MAGGRPRKPVERKRKTGNPGKRPLPVKAEVRILPQRADQFDPPQHLGREGLELWRVVTEGAGAWLAPGDMHTVLLVAESADRRAAMLAQVDNDGAVLYTDKGYAYAHPLLGAVSTLEKQMTSWLSLLGFTPSDRSKLGLAEVKRASKLDEIKQRREAKGR